MNKIKTIFITISASLFLVACTSATPVVSEITLPSPTSSEVINNQPIMEVAEKPYEVFKTEDITNQRNVMIIVDEAMNPGQIKELVIIVAKNECQDIMACVIDVHSSEESARLTVERQTVLGGEIVAWEEKNKPTIDKYWRGFFYVEDGVVNEDNSYQPS